MNGFEVMAWLAGRPEFQQLPVVVLTSSTNESDMEKARKAREYLVKPNDFRQLTKVLQDVAARWLHGAMEGAGNAFDGNPGAERLAGAGV